MDKLPVERSSLPRKIESHQKDTQSQPLTSIYAYLLHMHVTDTYVCLGLCKHTYLHTYRLYTHAKKINFGK